ncbi:bifunctional folylpolyglutamate synthase/dihydrofolate synthase [Deltaproteobacteria bacterium PRO3]|nr:bifunctional folylpolyglutamate synthase/dihydrofolate synthase [Deltaproteobacteria bacterium PRO3]
MTRLERFLAQSRGEYRRMSLGLHRMRELLEKIGHPDKAFACVLIAGTNGKGSTARMVESVLRCAGYRTGLYTSPHLVRFSERIRIGGREVSAERLEEILADWERAGLADAEGGIPAGEGERLTWFEQATLLAFEVFRREGVEFAVLEVGLGGRLDATNAAEPLASAIVSIGLDHTEVLGATLAEIAREKAGVLRPWRPLVLGAMPEKVREELRRLALEAGAFPILAGEPEGEPRDFSYADFTELSIPLEGRHQLANAAVAIELLWALAVRGWPWSETELREGLAAVSHPGRLERVEGAPPVLLDGAHNPQALEALGRYIQEKFPGRPVSVVLAMSKEKDPRAALGILGALKPRWYFTVFPNERSLPLERWRELAAAEGLTGDFFEKPEAALGRARTETPPEGLVVATGSLFLVGGLREALGLDSGIA